MPEPELFASINDLGQGDALEAWRFLVGKDAQVRLLTSMGDVFFLKPVGLLGRKQVFLLDTGTGKVINIESDWDKFKARVANPDPEVAEWLKYGFLCKLYESGKKLEQGQCFSPTIPPYLGGDYEPDNYLPTEWHVHLELSGRIYEQIKDLPPGTRIKEVKISKPNNPDVASARS